MTPDQRATLLAAYDAMAKLAEASPPAAARAAWHRDFTAAIATYRATALAILGHTAVQPNPPPCKPQTKRRR